ncbi:MAG TPA: LamG-like jellyroll fold domain-containing protein, partial [Candidatus Methylomirabilis sp.]|nr:LamG-like jellyroll fold domain-containing protein [Candidatus Methylomirabilis sp.]
ANGDSGAVDNENWDTAGTDNRATGPTAPTNNLWYYYASTFQSSKFVIVYQNGVRVASTTVASANKIGSSTAAAIIGAEPWDHNGYFVAGKLDEIRISNVARSRKWIATEYNNQNNPSTFFSTSTEQNYLIPSRKAVMITALPDSVSPAGYKWQALACNVNKVCSKNWTIFNSSMPNFKVDANAPSRPNPLAKIASTTSSMKLGFPTPVTEINFEQYKIYYRLGSTTPIHETDSLWGSSTLNDPNLGNLNFNGKASTTITGLSANTVYSFSLWAYDLAGNKSSSTFVWGRTSKALPAISGMTTCVAGGNRDSDCGFNAAPEYDSGDTYGLIQLNGTNFGASAGTIQFTGAFGTIAGTV